MGEMWAGVWQRQIAPASGGEIGIEGDLTQWHNDTHTAQET